MGTSNISSSVSTSSFWNHKESEISLDNFDSILSDMPKEQEITQSVTGKSYMVGDDAVQYIYTINLAIICCACCLFGLVTNTINIIVFLKMGFRETVNIALFGLSISDFIAVLSLLFVTICFNPLFMHSEVPIITRELQHKPGGWTHMIFSRITAFVTMYITLERCLCIAFPLKIKSLLTPRRVACIIVFIYVFIFGTMSQNYFTFRLGWKFVPSRNRTMLGMIFTANRQTIQTVTYYLNVIYPLVPLTGVVACSSILIWKLNQRTKWLNTATSSQDSGAMKSTKDRQVIKLIVSVAAIFICTFTPSVIFFLTIAVEPQLNIGKRYENLFILLISLTFTLHALNSSVNIFVYYKMSSKYKMKFQSLFCCGGDRGSQQQPKHDIQSK